MKVTRTAWVNRATKMRIGQITTIELEDGRWASHYGQPMTDDEAMDWAVDQLEAPAE